jgi:hypothetical protein
MAWPLGAVNSAPARLNAARLNHGMGCTHRVLHHTQGWILRLDTKDDQASVGTQLCISVNTRYPVGSLRQKGVCPKATSDHLETGTPTLMA